MKTKYVRALYERYYDGTKKMYGVEVLNEDFTHNQTITSITLKKVINKLENAGFYVIKLSAR